METPAPVDGGGQQNPDWFSEGTCKVGNGGVDGQDKVEAGDDGCEFSEVRKTDAVVNEVEWVWGDVDGRRNDLERSEANTFYRGETCPVGEGNRAQTIASVAGVSRPGKAYVEGVSRHGGGCRDVEWDWRWDVVKTDQVREAHQRGLGVEKRPRGIGCCCDEALVDAGRVLEEGVERGGDLDQDSSARALSGQGDEAEELKGVAVALLTVEQEGAAGERLSIPAGLRKALVEGTEAGDLQTVLEFLPSGAISAVQKKGKTQVPVGFFVCGVLLKQFFERSDAAGVTAQGKQVCEVFADGPCWVKFCGGAIRQDGIVEQATALLHAAEFMVSVRVVRIDSERLGEEGGAGGKFVELNREFAEIEESVGVVGIELNRACVGGDGGPWLAGTNESDAKAVEGIGEVWIELKGVPVGSEGVLPAVEAGEGVAYPQGNGGAGRVKAECLFEMFQSATPVCAYLGGSAEGEVSGGIARRQAGRRVGDGRARLRAGLIGHRVECADAFFSGRERALR